MVLKLFVGTEFHENGQKLQKLQNLIPSKFNTFKVSIDDSCPTTIGTLLEVNHREALPCTLFSTFLYSIQTVESGTQPTYLHDN